MSVEGVGVTRSQRFFGVKKEGEPVLKKGGHVGERDSCKAEGEKTALPEVCGGSGETQIQRKKGGATKKKEGLSGALVKQR